MRVTLRRGNKKSYKGHELRETLTGRGVEWQTNHNWGSKKQTHRT